MCVYEHLSELVKERQRESKKGSTQFLKEREKYLTVLCVCVWAFVWACKRETEREQKGINSIFKRERDIWMLCVCVCVYEHLSELVKERQRESKKGSTWFSKEREKKKKVSIRFLRKEKKKLISLHWKNLFPYFVKTSFPVSTSIQQMALHWSILNFF